MAHTDFHFASYHAEKSSEIGKNESYDFFKYNQESEFRDRGCLHNSKFQFASMPSDTSALF